MVDEIVINLVKKYLIALKREGINITKSIIFGSCARGTAGKESDIDLLLVSPLFDNDEDKYSGKIWRLTKISDYKIEPITIGEKRFNEDKGLIIIDIAKNEGYEVII